MVFLKYCLYVVIKTLKAYTQRIIELQNENVFSFVKLTLIQLNILRLQNNAVSEKVDTQKTILSTEKRIYCFLTKFFPIWENYLVHWKG